MNVQVQRFPTSGERRLPFERVALVLQGGGALGAYQARVYEALAEADIHPTRIAGVSIGAINAAVIAGNPPKDRVDRLREFWTQVTSGEVEGEHYWDGSLLSNTPLQRVVESESRRDTLAFQVDLWITHGEVQRNMLEGITRGKEIRYSSRTRAGADQFKHVQKLRRAVASLLEPEELKDSPEAKLLRTAAGPCVYNIIHLIYRAKNYEVHAQDYEFSQWSIEEHWRAGYRDARRTLHHPEVLRRPINHESVFTFDLAADGPEWELAVCEHRANARRYEKSQ